MKIIILILFTVFSYEVNSQYVPDSTVLGTFYYAKTPLGFPDIRIQVRRKDDLKEISYQSYNGETNRSYHRGTYIGYYKWFFNDLFAPHWDIYGAARNVVRAIKDSLNITEALRLYDSTTNARGLGGF